MGPPERSPNAHVVWAMALNRGHNSRTRPPPEGEERTTFVAGEGKSAKFWAPHPSSPRLPPFWQPPYFFMFLIFLFLCIFTFVKNVFVCFFQKKLIFVDRFDFSFPQPHTCLVFGRRGTASPPATLFTPNISNPVSAAACVVLIKDVFFLAYFCCPSERSPMW